MFNKVLEDQEMFGRIFFDSTTMKKAVIGRSKRVEDIAVLLENGDFEDHLAFVIFVNNLANTQSMFLKETIQNILNLIEE